MSGVHVCVCVCVYGKMVLKAVSVHTHTHKCADECVVDVIGFLQCAEG